MKAMILAAGEGTRIRDITDGEIPKPMVDLGQGPLLLHTVNQLVDFGVDEIVINLHHRGDTIRNFFGDEWRGTPIYYSEEDDLLGTAGGVGEVRERFEDSFILVYGDVLTDLDFEKFIDYHERKNSDATMLVYEEDDEHLVESSIIVTDQENEVQQFLEKPSRQEISEFEGEDFWTNAAVFVLEPEILELIPEGFSDFSRDIFPQVIETDSLKLFAYPEPDQAYWHEVGNPERYRKAVSDVEKEVIDFNSAKD